MESLGYVFMYFNRASLPWQGLSGVTKKQKLDKIREKKLSTPVEALCRGFPAEFGMYLDYCRGLRFEEMPDYRYLRLLFRRLLYNLRHQYDYVFDWALVKQKAIQKVTTSPPILPPIEFRAKTAPAATKRDIATAISRAMRGGAY